MNELFTAVNTKWESLAPSFPLSFRQPFEAGKNRITQALDETARKIEKIQAGDIYSDQEKARQKAELLAQARQTISGELEKLQKLVNDFKVQTATGLLPAKPTELDQGELLNLKADLQMLLNSLEPRKALQRMGELLDGSIKNKDGLPTWLLGGSNWPSLYTESRGLNPAEWEVVRNEVLAANMDEKQAQAWNQMKKLEGPDGVNGVLMSLKFVTNVALDKLA